MASQGGVTVLKLPGLSRGNGAGAGAPTEGSAGQCHLEREGRPPLLDGPGHQAAKLAARWHLIPHEGAWARAQGSPGDEPGEAWVPPSQAAPYGTS